MSNDYPWHHILWTTLASFAGAVTALSLRAFKGMTPQEIAFALLVGASFAIFVGPLVTYWIFGSGPVDLRVMGGVFYIMASGSNVLIPVTLRKVRALAGLEEEQPNDPPPPTKSGEEKS